MQLAGSRCATCLHCGTGGCVVVVAAVRVVVVHVAPRVETAAVGAVLTVIVVVPLVVVIDGPPRFWRDARALCGFRTRREIADPQSHCDGVSTLFDAMRR